MTNNDLRAGCPWTIPANAHCQKQVKAGYCQVKYSWKKAGWRYLVRWHEPLPQATLVTWPSWQCSRVRPGQGFGPHAHHRQEEMLVGKNWLPASQVRYYARRYSHGIATAAEIAVLRTAHRKGR